MFIPPLKSFRSWRRFSPWDACSIRSSLYTWNYTQHVDKTRRPVGLLLRWYNLLGKIWMDFRIFRISWFPYFQKYGFSRDMEIWKSRHTEIKYVCWQTCMYVGRHTKGYGYVFICVCEYIYIERERQRNRERGIHGPHETGKYALPKYTGVYMWGYACAFVCIYVERHAFLWKEYCPVFT